MKNSLNTLACDLLQLIIFFLLLVRIFSHSKWGPTNCDTTGFFCYWAQNVYRNLCLNCFILHSERILMCSYRVISWNFPPQCVSCPLFTRLHNVWYSVSFEVGVGRTVSQPCSWCDHDRIVLVVCPYCTRARGVFVCLCHMICDRDMLVVCSYCARGVSVMCEWCVCVVILMWSWCCSGSCLR